MSLPAEAIVRCPQCGQANRVPAAANGVPRCGNCHNPLPWMVDADDNLFEAAAEQATVPVLVDVWAPWCGPCRIVTPTLEHLARERAGKLKLVKVNADESPGVSQRFEVRAIPTLLLMDHGRVLARQIGALPEERLVAWLSDALG
jgi:thioredoxin 2